jgi:2-methylcitrate dehydratase PrpD
MSDRASDEMTITSELARFCARLDLDSLPDGVAERARFLVLDLAGNAIRARHAAESKPALLRAVEALGLGRGEAGVFADDAGYAPAAAALLNGALGHSLDFDDTHAAAIVHPGAPVIPAALAAAEMIHASGAEALAGIIAGYEVALRLALALPAGEHYELGFHPSATCGAFGATAAAARVFGLEAEVIGSAFGIVLSQTAGSLQFLANGAWTKRFQVGWAAMAGLAAASLAREGFVGAADAIEGRHGFLNAYGRKPHPARVLEALGERFELMATAVKPYPSCRWGHAGIDAALALRREVDLEAVEEVVLGLSRAGMLLIGEPAAKKADPRNIVDAQFSGPFVIAVALLTGQMGWESYGLLQDGQVRRIMSKVRCEADPDIEALFPEKMAGKLTVTAAGRTVSRIVEVPKGEPSDFLSEAELRAKFDGLAVPVLGESTAREIADMVLHLDGLHEITPLVRRSCGDPSVRRRERRQADAEGAS